MKIEALIRPDVDSLEGYAPGEPSEALARRLEQAPDTVIKLDANENPYGAPPGVLERLAALPAVHLYPDQQSRALREALATFTGVPADLLLAGAGSDELIATLCRLFLTGGGAALNCPPTFSMYPFFIREAGGRVIDIPRREDFSLDLEAIEQAVERERPRLLFLASPNNPDGSRLPDEALERLLALPLVVVVDEAYVEFSDHESRITQVPERENLVVLRTFSKWAGLAGLRVGYGAFPAALVPYLWRLKEPYTVSVAASAAALAVLERPDYLPRQRARIAAERRRLTEGLDALPGLQPYPSEANFVLCRVDPEVERAGALRRALEEEGILVRGYGPGALENSLRIAVGRPDQVDALLEALNRLLGGDLTLERPPAPRQESTGGRAGRVSRNTRETQVEVELNLDGRGRHEVTTGVGFLDHMLAQIAAHGLFDLTVRAQGDRHIDAHHTVEDVALALGTAFDQALGSRRGIVRMGSAYVPMDESLGFVAVDLSGRPYAVVEGAWSGSEVGSLPITLIAHFFESFAVAARANLHARIVTGRDDHHKAEALFKALARALSAATRRDPRRGDRVPSTKGVL